MSVTSVERLQERGGNLGSHSRITQTYLVRTNSRDDGFFEVREAIENLVGGFLSPHPDSMFYTRREINLSAASPLHWTATVPWSTEPISNRERERNDFPNPIDRRARISVESRETQKYVTKDYEDTPLKNTAGEPIEPLPTDFTDVILNIRQNIPTYQASWIQDFSNSTNEKPVIMTDGVLVLGIDADKGLLKAMNFSSLQEENGFQFYEAGLKIHVTHDSEYKWKTVLINEGFRYLDGTKLIRFCETDESGTLLDGTGGTDRVFATTPKKLDATGAALADDADPVLLEFELYKKADWSELPFFSKPS